MRGVRIAPFLLALLRIGHAQTIQIIGTAHSAGYLSGCTVTLTQGNAARPVSGTAITDSRGLFTLTVIGATNASHVINSYLTVTNSATCKDTATGLQLPLLLGALVDVPSGTQGAGPVPVVVNGLTTLVYYTKKNIGSPQIAPYAIFFGGNGFTARQFYTQFANSIGIALGERAAYTDLISASLTGVSKGVDAQGFNVQVISSLTLAASFLTGIKPEITSNAASEAFVVAVYPAAAGYLLAGKSFSLSSGESLTAIFNKVIGNVPQDIVSAGSEVLAQVNAYVANLTATLPAGTALLTKFAEVLAVSQTKLTKAAYNLGAKTLSPVDARAAYTGPGLQRVLGSSRVPGMLNVASINVAPAPAPAVLLP